MCLILGFILSCAPIALAEQSAGSTLRLDIPTAISMAFDASEDLRISENEVLRKESEKKEELSYAFPHIMGAGGWSNNFEYPDIPATAATQDYHLNTGVTISQTLFTFGRISKAVAAAGKAAEASCFNKENIKQEIIYNAKLAYYNAYLAKRVFEIAQESYANAGRNKEILLDRNARGRVSKYENIKISADISSRIPAVNNARADFISAMESLKVVIGAGSADTIELIEGFPEGYPDFDREKLALALYNNQPAIKSLAETIREKEDLISSKKAALLPEISAFATWEHKGDSRDYYVGRDQMDDYGVAGLKISVPIWLGGISREKLRQATLDRKNAELEYRKGQEDYLLLLDTSVNAFREYQKTLAANQEAIRWAGEFFVYSQELFGSGQVSVTDLNDAELQLTNAKMNKEMTLFNLNVILAQIQRLTLIGANNE